MWRRDENIRQRRYAALLLGLACLAFAFGALLLQTRRVVSPRLGVTFSTRYAEELGLDWRETFRAMLADLDVRHIRVPVYWADVEPSPGIFAFDDLDALLADAAARRVPVTLAIGHKVPRWPECFWPEWAKNLSPDEERVKALEMIDAIVTRYRNHPAVVRWQVENEPFLAFGECAAPDVGFMRQEIEHVKALSDKPIATTTSGELEPWFQTIPFAKEVGFSLYRLTWHPVFGFLIYPLQPRIYRARIKALAPFVDRVYVSELQAEPWFHKPPVTLSLDEQMRMFSPRMLKENVRFARRLGVDQIDLWGVEWWYSLKKGGEDAMWLAAQEVFGQPK